MSAPPIMPTILLVEDDRLILHTLAAGLRDAGYCILPADSAESAMRACVETRPDLALLDMRLPGMSGSGLAFWLKNTLDVPFLFLSAYSDPETVRATAELGALGYLVKPLDIPQIIPSIETALRRGQEIHQLHQAEINLSIALKTSRNISIAIGCCMEKYGLGADESFEALRAYCRSNRLKMPEVADRFIRDGGGIDLTPHLAKRTGRQ